MSKDTFCSDSWGSPLLDIRYREEGKRNQGVLVQTDRAVEVMREDLRFLSDQSLCP